LRLLHVDPAVDAAIDAALAYYTEQGASERVLQRVAAGFRAALTYIGTAAESGRRIEGLPPRYRRIRLARNLPAYVSFYRLEPDESILVYLCRHEHQQARAASTLRRKAGAAARRIKKRPI